MKPDIFQCTVFLKAVRSFVSDVSTSFDKSRGGPDGSGGGGGVGGGGGGGPLW